jgi:Na+-translocating ferredoxin:NAD+ oxidoreductase RnfD subunit
MQNGPTPKRRFQFHLATLFVFVTVAAVAFALIGRFGFDGFVERLVGALMFASLFVPLVEFYYYRKRELDEGW